jgi:PKD repeat protein
LLRKTFMLPPGATNVRVQVAIDNDIVGIWVNGTLIQGPKTHDLCAARGDTGTFLVPAGAFNPGGSNLIAMRGRDRGGDCYLDVYVSADVPVNQPPIANAGGPYVGSEGSSISLAGASASDPDNDPLSYSWTVSSPKCSFDNPNALNPNLTCKDNGSYTATLTVSDGIYPPVSSTVAFAVSNVAPAVGAISVNQSLIAVGASVTASANFTDPGTLDTHTALWNWGDGNTSAGVVTESNGSGAVSGTHPYTTPNVYVVTLTVTDKDGDSSTTFYQYVVVYDPSGAFVTGGGWIDSPAGAYVADPNLIGKANFGFVSKYEHGATVPTGNTTFRFQAANLGFQSTSYDWLVVGGARAQFKGTGTINGAGSYTFMLTAIDGQLNGGGGVDKFRIRIWGDDGLVYDNQLNAPDTADPTTALVGGSIFIHKQ